jgi:uncharacterized protein (TIGR02246 family)
LLAVAAPLGAQAFSHRCLAPRLSARECQQIADAVRQRADAMHAAAARKDAAGMVAWFADEATVVDQGRIYPGLEQMRQNAATMFTAFDRVSFAWTDALVDVLAPDVAALTGSWRGEFVDLQGKRTEFSGMWSGTLLRRGGQWRVYNAHSSGPPPR